MPALHKEQQSEVQTTAKTKPSVADVPPINKRAFFTNEDGLLRSESAAKAAKHRAVKSTIDAVQQIGNTEQQALALHDATNSTQLSSIAALAGVHLSKDVEVALFHQQQMKKMTSHVSESSASNKALSHDKQSHRESVLVAVAKSPDNNKQVPSLASRVHAMGLPSTTGKCLFRGAKAKRSCLTKREENTSWSVIKSQKQHNTVQRQSRKKVHKWVLNNPHVTSSPLCNDTILTTDPSTGKKD